jgi:hypothetical protein
MLTCEYTDELLLTSAIDEVLLTTLSTAMKKPLTSLGQMTRGYSMVAL